MTCRGQKAGLGLIGQFSRFLGTRNLLLGALALGNVGRQTLDAFELSSGIEFSAGDLLKPDFAIAISSHVAECRGI